MQILPKRIRPLEISQLRLAIWLSVLLRLIHPADVRSQDILAQHRIDALKGLSEISIILRPNAQSEVLSVREVGDYLEVTVRRRLPELRISSNSASVPAWLELSYVSTDRGATLERHRVTAKKTRKQFDFFECRLQTTGNFNLTNHLLDKQTPRIDVFESLRLLL
jgi:hypothetical protein